MQTDFLRKGRKEGYSLGFEGLFLRKDFIEAGIEPCVFMEEQFHERTDQTVPVAIKRCLGKKEFLECRRMTPRYVRVCKDMDVRVSPITMNERINYSRWTVSVGLLQGTEVGNT